MQEPRIVIVGAGISGLALGYFLKQQGYSSITLIEKEKRVGGWIKSLSLNDFLFEEGPRSLRPTVTTLQLIEDLQLEKDVVLPDKSAKKRYLYVQNRLKPIPGGFLKTILKGIWRDLFTPPNKTSEETIHEFFTRRFGLDFANTLGDAITTGVFAGNSKQLSLKSSFPSFYKWEQEHGSVIKGMFKKKRLQGPLSPFVQKMMKLPLYTFKSGMETLIKALASHLNIQLNVAVESIILETAVQDDKVMHDFELESFAVGGTHSQKVKLPPAAGDYHSKDCVNLSSSTAVSRIILETEPHIKLKLSNGTTIEADHLFLAIPPAPLKKLIPEVSLISTGSVASINVGYSKNLLPKKGFGYLIPSQEEEDILGMVFDSSAFPHQNKAREETRITIMIGGKKHPFVDTYSKETLEDIALKALKKQLLISTRPDALHISILKNAIPQYFVGHEKSVESIEKEIEKVSPRLTLLGSGFYGVSINECIERALLTSKKTFYF